MRRAALLVALGLACACDDTEIPPRPQWIVEISTDAPVPQLGDRLYVEVVDGGDGPCAACRRTFGLDKGTRWPLSFGVGAEAGRSPRVRARLYRARDTGRDGLPETASVDAIASLPRDPVEPRRLALTLRTQCFGVPSDLAAGATCDPETRTPTDVPTLEDASPSTRAVTPGSWPPAQPRPCSGPAPAGTVCIEGGVFLIGDVRQRGFVGGSAASAPERLVQVSPFAMDVDEVSVGLVRRLVRAGSLADEPRLPTGDTGCTYVGASDATNDALPVNCVSLRLAKAICEARDMRLPTEAEWEYAAGGGAEERRFPWGDALGDACGRAIVGRGRSIFELPASTDLSTACRVVDGEPLRPWGPVAGGAPGDVSAAGVKNLGGNVAEWVLDRFVPYAGPCWSSGILVDPRCGTEADLPLVRGGDWQTPPFASGVAHRGVTLHAEGSSKTGLRCVRPM